MDIEHEHPPVTWLLPVRNGMPFLTDTLRSLAAQTYPHHRVLAWDNGSTDGSVEELMRWIGRGRPLNGEVVSDQPLGLGASLAAMVERAPTDLCARIDADDLCLPQRLERQVALLMSDPRIAVVDSALRVIDEKGALVAELPASVTADADLRWHLRLGNCLAHPSVLFRREAILAVGNYRDIMPGQDYDLWCRVAERYRMGKVAESLVCYRMHERSVTAANLSRSREIVEEVQRTNHERLWPGLSLETVARLRRLLADPADLGVTLHDWRSLREAATRAATACGERPDYFRRTTRYQHHASGLMTRLAKRQPVVRTVWPVLRSVRHRFPMASNIHSPHVPYQPRREAA